MKALFLSVIVSLSGLMPGILSDVKVTARQTNSAKELVGLWQAKNRYGPEARGSLLITQNKDGWRAEIAGISVAAQSNKDMISFELPDEKGKFQGRFDARRTKISGFWMQPGTVIAANWLNGSAVQCLWILEIVNRNDRLKVFRRLPKRWIVERTFSWLNRNRRLSKDYKRKVESSESWLYSVDVNFDDQAS